MIDAVFTHSVTVIEELLHGADPGQPLHLMLASPGGDGEVAIRLIRSLHSRCSELTIIVPDMAKSAATLMCLGADRILMGPASDLGPVDPQFQIGNNLVGAADIERAVSDAELRVAQEPNTFPLYASLLSDVNMLMVEQARSQMARSYDLILEALECRGLDAEMREGLLETLKGPLVDQSKFHGATIGPDAAKRLGLPVESVNPASDVWQIIWELWTRYFHAGAYPAGHMAIYEGRYASQVLG